MDIDNQDAVGRIFRHSVPHLLGMVVVFAAIQDALSIMPQEE